MGLRNLTASDKINPPFSKKLHLLITEKAGDTHYHYSAYRIPRKPQNRIVYVGLVYVMALSLSLTPFVVGSIMTPSIDNT